MQPITFPPPPSARRRRRQDAGPRRPPPPPPPPPPPLSLSLSPPPPRALCLSLSLCVSEGLFFFFFFFFLALRGAVCEGELKMAINCADTYIDPLMNWLDARSTSYLAWAWNADFNCSTGPGLITSYAGTASAYGAGYRSHLRSLRWRLACRAGRADASTPGRWRTDAPMQVQSEPAHGRPHPAGHDDVPCRRQRDRVPVHRSPRHFVEGTSAAAPSLMTLVSLRSKATTGTPKAMYSIILTGEISACSEVSSPRSALAR